jgi:tripartite-type tricarboxylate transporter receptor subunit TctC
LKDFTYIARLADSSIGILVRSDSPWKTLKEFLEYAKANPGKIKYGTANPRGSLGLAMVDLGLKEGIKWDVVPFSGGNEVVTALLGKHINAICQGPEYIPFVESGDLRLLALIGDQRFKRFPNVPTLKEMGYVPTLVPSGIIGPANMPKDVTDKLADAFKKALDDPKVRKVLEDTGSPISYQNSAQYTAWAKASVVYYADLIKRAGLAKK